MSEVIPANEGPAFFIAKLEVIEQLKAENARLQEAIKEIWDEVTGDKDWDIVETACRNALGRSRETP